MSHELQRPDPDALLAGIKVEEMGQRGRLRIWLGAAPGAGKTFAMLCEGHRRKSRGADVVIGFVETHGRKHLEEQIGDLEIVPPRTIPNLGGVRLEMDTDAVIARHPKVALVDELAHTNAPGSRHEKRWQDVQELLDAGITVVTTLNVGSIESLRDYVQQSTGITVAETVPDSVIDAADQVELIDLSPDAFIQRVKDGQVFSPVQAEQALSTAFTPGNLTTLRDLALRATAREVEEKFDTYLHDRKVEGLLIGERIMVAVDHRPFGSTLIRGGWRLAAALKGELIVVHVEPVERRRKPQSVEDERQLATNLQLAEDLGAQIAHLRGKVAEELIAFARMHHVSHLFIGHPSHRRWEEFLRGSVTSTILHQAPGVSVHAIGDTSHAHTREAVRGSSEAPPAAAERNPDRSLMEYSNSPSFVLLQDTNPVSSQSGPATTPSRRGTLRLFLGAAPGVGKTYAMLQAAQTVKSQGVDIIVGVVETHSRPHTAEQMVGLEIVPPREVPYGNVVLPEMDIDAVIARHPAVVLVDELAHTNAAGSRHGKRYQDVFEIVDHGIDVYSTMNVQHLESLNDIVEQMTGVRVHETVPDWVIDEADTVELIDMAPEALIRRMTHGNIYSPEQAKRALENFFTVGNLTALRDLALRITAKEVEDQLAGYMRDGETVSELPTGEKVMVAVDFRPDSRSLIREGWRMATALNAELVVISVDPAQGRRQAQSIEEERELRANLQLAEELGAKVVRTRGKVSEEMIGYARTNRVSQLVIGHPSHSRWEEFLFGSVTSDVLRQMPGIDVHVLPHRDPSRSNAGAGAKRY